MRQDNFDYNTQRPNLVIREYGRHLQSMVEYAASVEDREKRNKLTLGIIDLMGQMNPHLRNVEEFRHKLWDHIYFISGGKLDVDSPYPKPNYDELVKRKPGSVTYPKQKIRFKHYGINVEQLIEKAKVMEDEEKKKDFTECIGNYMKLVHRNWNKENPNDEIIKQDIVLLSDGALKLENDSNLDSLSRATPRRKRPDNFKASGRHDRGGHGRDRNRDSHGKNRHGGGGGGGGGRHRDNRNRRDKKR